MDKKFWSFVGLCQKSGKILSGEFACENAVKSSTAALVLLAGDASANTKKKFVNKCDFYSVPIIIADESKVALGNAIGRQMRSVIAVIDKNMASHILELIN